MVRDLRASVTVSIELLLVARLHVDLQRVASAVCRRD
jgi:hypothetical protein